MLHASTAGGAAKAHERDQGPAIAGQHPPTSPGSLPRRALAERRGASAGELLAAGAAGNQSINSRD